MDPCQQIHRTKDNKQGCSVGVDTFPLEPTGTFGKFTLYCCLWYYLTRAGFCLVKFLVLVYFLCLDERKQSSEGGPVHTGGTHAGAKSPFKLINTQS